MAAELQSVLEPELMPAVVEPELMLVLEPGLMLVVAPTAPATAAVRSTVVVVVELQE